MNRQRWITGCAAACLLAGCSVMDVANESVSAAIRGKPLANAVRALGIPVDDKQVAGLRVVTWRTGAIAKGQQGCELRAVVDAQEIVTGYEFEGARGTCYSWLRDVK